MTTGISLVRENAEAMQPPRTLWVPFALGRPLGVPGDAAFQHQVIQHALNLLERPKGPVLEDFPLDAPMPSTEQAPACPVSFARPSTDESSWQSRLHNELLVMKPWYDLSRRRRGRTTVGVSRQSIDECAALVAQWLDHSHTELPDLTAFKAAVEDLKTYYSEAMTAQPGDYPPQSIQMQIWQDTQLGEAMRRYYEFFKTQPELSAINSILVPRAVLGSDA